MQGATSGQLVKVHGLTVQVPTNLVNMDGSGAVTACQSKGLLWPEFPTGDAILLPSHGEPGACLAAVHAKGSDEEHGCKMWAYGHSTQGGKLDGLAVGLCKEGKAMLDAMATDDKCPASLKALAAIAVNVDA